MFQSVFNFFPSKHMETDFFLFFAVYCSRLNAWAKIFCCIMQTVQRNNSYIWNRYQRTWAKILCCIKHRGKNILLHHANGLKKRFLYMEWISAHHKFKSFTSMSVIALDDDAKSIIAKYLINASADYVILRGHN